MSQAETALPIIHVATMGNLANQAIQYMVALALARRLGPCPLSNVHLPIWGIHHPYITGDFPDTLVVTADRVDFDQIARQVRQNAVSRVEIRTYGQRMQNFLDRAAYASRFPGQDIEVAGCGGDELLCNIRGGDILDGHHKDYTLLPVAYYQEIVENTGLRPVFLGQLGDNAYTRGLRQVFPDAAFIESRGPAVDFEAIRRSRNIVLGISTFSWLAAWLSDAQQIWMPVSGLFHPVQSRSCNLLPLDDPRYRFTLFPLNFAVAVDDYAASHRAMDGLWRYLRPDMLVQMLAGTPHVSRSREKYLPHFDESFYLAAYPDIRQSVEQGHLPSGLHHFFHYGYEEGREAFRLDRVWYTRRYPIAAVEVGQGDYVDLLHHFVEIGEARGYKTCAQA